MKGIIFNLLEESVRSAHGENFWDDLLDAAGVQGAYTSLGSYPDQEMADLVAAASQRLHVPAGEVLRWFGRAAVPLLAEKYPGFFRPHQSCRSFLLTLNDIIHAEVRKLYPGSEVPVFAFDTNDPECLVVEYYSSRRLCSLAIGMVEGAAHQFSERAVVLHPRCKQAGAERCVLEIDFIGARN